MILNVSSKTFNWRADWTYSYIRLALSVDIISKTHVQDQSSISNIADIYRTKLVGRLYALDLF